MAERLRLLLTAVVLTGTVLVGAIAITAHANMAQAATCQVTGYRPYASTTASGYGSCTTTAYRYAEIQLKENVSGPDKVCGYNGSYATSAQYSRAAVDYHTYDNDGNLQYYFSKMLISVGRSYLVQNDSLDYASHYEGC